MCGGGGSGCGGGGGGGCCGGDGRVRHEAEWWYSYCVSPFNSVFVWSER